MSGGHFDYKQYVLQELSDEIERVLNRQGKPKPEDETYGDYYKDHPEECIYPYYPEKIQVKMREAIEVLNRAGVYVQRIDWFLSGDDGEESFLERLEEELK